MSYRYSNTDSVTLFDLVSRLNVDYDNGDYMKCFCPNCSEEGKRERKLHLNFEKNCWRCVKCNQSGGVLRFYSGYVKGDINLPTDKKELGKLSEELREFMGLSSTPKRQAPPKLTPPRPRAPIIPVAPDDRLHQVYSEMMELPELKLLPHHKKNLLKRGLIVAHIDANGYRSVPENWEIPAAYGQMYQEAGGNRLAKELFGWVNAYRIKFGLMVADHLLSKNLELTGVPGFFRFGPHWCFWSVPGILIPTRNILGQIVVWQVRSDHVRKDAPKYITVSKQKLPGHTTEQVSRCHFPLNNAPLDSKAPVLITEGPLKADVASALYGRPTIFAAILGVSNTNDLLRYCDTFKKANITSVVNAFDMDKLTNKNVRDGVHLLRKKFRDHGMQMQDLFWGDAYASSKLLRFIYIARLHNIPIPMPEHNTVFYRLEAVCTALDEAKIRPCKIQTSGGESNCYWEPETKGIDDYLLTQSRR